MKRVYVVSEKDDKLGSLLTIAAYEYFPLAVYRVHKCIIDQCQLIDNAQDSEKIQLPSKHVLRAETVRAIELLDGVSRIYDVLITADQRRVYYTVTNLPKTYRIEMLKVQS